MKQYFLFLILTLFVCQSIAQDISFTDVTENLNNDSLSTEKKGALVHDYLRSIHMNPEIKEKRLKEVLPVILQYNEPTYYWDWNMAYVHTLKEYGKFLEASDHAYEMLKVAEKENNDKWRSDVYAALYGIHMDLQMKDKAKGFLKKAVEAAYAANDIKRISANSYLMGYTYYVERKNDSAVHYLQVASYYNLQLDNEGKTAEYPYLLARTYIRDQQYDKGISILDSIVKNRENRLNRYYNDYYYAGSLMYMSQAYALKGMLDSSDYLFEKSLKSYISFDTVLYNYAHLYNGMTHVGIGEYERALKSFNYLNDSTDFDVPKEFIASAYAGKGDKNAAISFYKLAINEKDSTQTVAIEEMTALLGESSKAELEIQKQIDDEKQAAAEQQAADQEKQKNIILVGVGIIGILILIFGRILYKRYKIIKAQKEEINEQKMQVEEKNEEILDSINYAKRIQLAILPPDKIFKKYLPNSFILYKPKDVVAGDFYWMEHVGDQVIFAAADCTGHGVPGAMVSVVCHNALNRSVREFSLTDPAKILDKTRELVIETFEKSEQEVKDGMDIALCTFNQKTNELLFAGANNPLYLIRDGEVQEFKGDKQPIGVYSDPYPFKTNHIQLQKGDQYYIFTDGFADQFGGEKGKKFKPKNFRDHLVRYQNEKTEKVKILLDTTFERWKGDLEQVDDVCVIGVRI